MIKQNENMPKVSIIIPVYGVEKYIERCARSLFEQTLDDIEYLFIDDCTPDKSVEILKRVLEEYPHRKSQVVIHRMEKNSGQAAVRKWGMLNATGDYVIHCDSDDWLDKDAYSIMYQYACDKDVDIVVSDYFISDSYKKNKIVSGASKEDINNFISSCLLQKYSWALWNKMICKRLCRKGISIWPTSNMGEDFLMFFQMLFHANSMGYINKPLYYYFSNDQSISFEIGKEKDMKRFFQIYDNAKHLFSIINTLGFSNKYTTEMTSFAYYVKSYIAKYVDDIIIYNKWKETFKEYNKRILLNRKIGIYDKLLYILTMLRIYPYLKKI